MYFLWFTASRFSCCLDDHQLCTGKCYWLYEAVHESRHRHFVQGRCTNAIARVFVSCWNCTGLICVWRWRTWCGYWWWRASSFCTLFFRSLSLSLQSAKQLGNRWENFHQINTFRICVRRANRNHCWTHWTKIPISMTAVWTQYGMDTNDRDRECDLDSSVELSSTNSIRDLFVENSKLCRLYLFYVFFFTCKIPRHLVYCRAHIDEIRQSERERVRNA